MTKPKTKVPKPILFVGILMLLAGILTRRMFDMPYLGLFMILFGVALKTYYIIAKARAGEYKPGRELWFLFIGLALFLGGIYARAQGLSAFNPVYMMVAGITLKVIFIIRFVQLTRAVEKRAIEGS